MQNLFSCKMHSGLRNRYFYVLTGVSLLIFSLSSIGADFKPSAKSVQRIENHLFEYMQWNADVKHIDMDSQDINISGNLGENGIRSPKDDTPMDLFQFEGEKGDIVQVSLGSNEFDAVTWILESESRLLLEGDDDSGNNFDAVFKTVLPKDGKYLLVVNSYGKTGSYELKLEKLKPLSISKDSTAKKRAVLIGVGDYFGAENDLSASLSDVELMQNLLVNEAGFDSDSILVIKDQYATRENIYEVYEKFLSSAPKDGLVLLYYSGHGVQLSTDNNSESDRKDEALLFADSSYLLDDELQLMIGCLASNKVVVIVDSCYSGGIDRGTGQKSVAEHRIKNYLEIARNTRPNLSICESQEMNHQKDINIVISAAGEDQKAWESSRWNNFSGSRSVFTHYFVEGVAKALKDKSNIPMDELHKEISQNVKEFTLEHITYIQEGKIVGNSLYPPTVKDAFGLGIE